MPLFNYRAVDKEGYHQKGTIEADSQNEAISSIKEMRLYPTQVEKVKDGKDYLSCWESKVPTAEQVKDGKAWLLLDGKKPTPEQVEKSKKSLQENNETAKNSGGTGFWGFYLVTFVVIAVAGIVIGSEHTPIGDILCFAAVTPFGLLLVLKALSRGGPLR